MSFENPQQVSSPEKNIEKAHKEAIEVLSIQLETKLETIGISGIDPNIFISTLEQEEN